MHRHFTATAYIVDKQSRFLMIKHKKIGKWLPPGGHVEENELPHETALREVHEETGIRAALYLQENLWITRWNASSLPRPFLCLLEELPPHGIQPAHQHIDQIYVGYPVQETPLLPEAAWMDLSTLYALKPDQEIFVETLQTLKVVHEFIAKL